MEEIVLDNDFSPEEKKELKRAFDLGALFAELSPEEFIKVLRSHREENQSEPKK